jgi:hypothetical protein
MLWTLVSPCRLTSARSPGVANPKTRCPQEISSPAMKNAPIAATTNSSAHDRSLSRHRRRAMAQPHRHEGDDGQEGRPLAEAVLVHEDAIQRAVQCRDGDKERDDDRNDRDGPGHALGDAPLDRLVAHPRGQVFEAFSRHHDGHTLFPPDPAP